MKDTIGILGSLVVIALVVAMGWYLGSGDSNSSSNSDYSDHIDIFEEHDQAEYIAELEGY